MTALPFQFECPAAFFEKAEAPQGQRRRIAGIISTESRDRQQEIVIQRGLDFHEFIANGWFNDNHSKDTDGIVGYPAFVKYFEKGQRLPNGESAKTNLTWAEGYLLEGHDRSDRLWNLGMALQKAGYGRRLGFSVEGGVEKREGPERRTIAKARVRNVAITNCPVNTDTRLEIIAKSLMAVQQTGGSVLDRVVKALTMGTTAPGFVVGQAPVGPRTGAAAGQILTPESLETDERKLTFEFEDSDEEDPDKKENRKLNKAEAILWLHKRMPHVSAQTLGRIVDTTLLLKRKGML